MKRSFTIVFLLLALTLLSFTAQAAEHEYSVYYKDGDGVLQTFTTVAGKTEYGYDVGVGTAPALPADTDKLQWDMWSVRYDDGKPGQGYQFLGWVYPGDSFFTTQAVYLARSLSNIPKFSVYVGLHDGDAWQEVYWTHTVPGRLSSEYRRWDYLYFVTPAADAELGLELPQGTSLQRRFWDFYIVPPEDHDVTHSGAVRVGQLFPEGDFLLDDHMKKYYRNYCVMDPAFDESTSFEGYDFVLTPVFLSADPETDDRSGYYVLYKGPDGEQHTVPTYYSQTLEMAYFLVPDPAELGLAKKGAYDFDHWELYEAMNDYGQHFYFDKEYDFVCNITQAPGTLFEIDISDLYLVPNYGAGGSGYSGEQPVEDDCEWGFWYLCSDPAYIGEGVYEMKEGRFFFEFGVWADDAETSVSITLPAEVPQGMAAPAGQVLTGWNIFGPVTVEEGSSSDSLVIGGKLLATVEPGAAYVFVHNNADVYAAPVWEDAGTPKCIMTGSIHDADLGVLFSVDRGGSAVLVAVRLRGGRVEAVEVMDIELFEGVVVDNSVFKGFCRDGASYKLMLVQQGSLKPLCNSWEN